MSTEQAQAETSTTDVHDVPEKSYRGTHRDIRATENQKKSAKMAIASVQCVHAHCCGRLALCFYENLMFDTIITYAD